MIILKTVKPINGEYYRKEIEERYHYFIPRIGETIKFYFQECGYKGKVSDIIHDVHSSLTIFTYILIDNVEKL